MLGLEAYEQHNTATIKNSCLVFIMLIDSSRHPFPPFEEMNVGKEMATLGIKKCVTAKETALGKSEQKCSVLCLAT